MINREYVLLVLVLTAFLVPCSAGDDPVYRSNPTHRASKWFKLVQENHSNLFDVMTAMNADTSIQPEHRSHEYQKAIKWLSRRRGDIDALGNIGPRKPSSSVIDAYISRSVKSESPFAQSSSVWKSIGPFSWDRSAKSATGSAGIGVVRCHVVDPRNPSLIIVGTISAGIWRSDDGGATWVSVGSALPVQTVWRLAMSGQVVYAATDAGLYRSENRGLTFIKVRLSGESSLEKVEGVDHVAVAPGDHNRLVIAALGRLFVTSNGGATWAAAGTLQGTWWDLLWHPTRNDVCYALLQRGGHIAFVRSTNSGGKFNEVGEGYPSPNPNFVMSRALLAVTGASPRNISVCIGGSVRDGVGGVYGIYTSVDEGATFTHNCCGNIDGPETTTADNPNLFDYDKNGNGLGQITWDMGFAVSNTNPNNMIVAGIFPYLSTNGGSTWTSLPPMHYDIQSVSMSGDTIWITHDGGISRSIDKGLTFQDRSDGISALEIWGFDQSQNGSTMTIGAYHMPIFIRDPTVYNPAPPVDGWYAWSGADAMGANVNPIATEWLYAKPWTSVRAQRTRTKAVAPRAVDLGIDLGYITMTNVCVDPRLYTRIVACDHATQQLVVSNDNASTWRPIRQFSNWMFRVRQSASDGSRLMVIGDSRLFYSTNLGDSWADITPPAGMMKNKSLQDMAFSYTDPKRLFVCFGGHQNDVKVLESSNSGVSWFDVSGDLPAMAIRTMISRRGSSAELYLGTSAGVYTKTDEERWNVLGTGLPLTDVNFLSEADEQGLLRAATLRGIWQIDLKQRTRPRAQLSQDVDTVRCSKTPVRFGDRSAVLHSPGFSRLWQFPGGSPATSVADRVNVTYAQPGKYNVTLVITTEQGSDSMSIQNAVTVLPSECTGFDRTPASMLDLTAPADHATLGRFVGTVQEFSFSAWVKPVGIQPSFSAILCTDVDDGVEQEIGVQFVNDKNELGYLWKDGRWWWNSGLTVRPDEWSHVALVIDSTGAVVYVNGIGSRETFRLPPQNLSALIFKLGTYHYWSSRNFKGYIDEVCIYNRALSEDDVRLGMHRTKRSGEAGLIGYYQFNESDPTVLYDKVAARNGSLESRASKRESDAPVGDAETEIVEMLDRQSVLIFDSLGDRFVLNNPIEGAKVLLSKMLIGPTGLMPTATVIKNRYWILDVFSAGRELHEIEAVDLSCIGLFEPVDTLGRKFDILSRDGWTQGPSWTNIRAKQPGRYNQQTHSLSFTFHPGMYPSQQFVIQYAGAPVGVDDYEKHVSVSPNPSGTTVRVQSREPINAVCLYDCLGRQVLNNVYENADMRVHLDVLDLPVGSYTLFVNRTIRLPLVINR